MFLYSNSHFPACVLHGVVRKAHECGHGKLPAYPDTSEASIMLVGRHAGKSTFLDLLAGRKTVGEQKGDILFSGVRPTSGFLKRYTGAFSPLSSCIITFFADSLA